MKNTFVILAILPLIIFASCSKDEPEFDFTSLGKPLLLELQSYIGKPHYTNIKKPNPEIDSIMKERGYTPIFDYLSYKLEKGDEMRYYDFPGYDNKYNIRVASFGIISENIAKYWTFVNLFTMWGDLCYRWESCEGYKGRLIVNDVWYDYSNRQTYQRMFSDYKDSLVQCHEYFKWGSDTLVTIIFDAIDGEYCLLVEVEKE